MDRLFEKLVQWRSASRLPLLSLALLVFLAAPARGDEKCTVGLSPAATLLLPYFEVDPGSPTGLTTLFSINNASVVAVLANVTVWTDLGVATFSFPVYLTGYDVQTINLRDLFNGNLPQTASAGQDPIDTISPKGPYSQDINFASCSALPPPALPAAFVAHLRAAHSGQFSAVLNGCAGQNLGDGRLRGYVTVDTVSACAPLAPGDSGYFGPGGIATNDNVLWGDYFYVDPDNKYSDGENLVRIKAFPGAFKQGDLTFYGRYVGMSGVDNRQPLPTTWGSRYVNGGAFSGGTDVLVWRDSGQVVKPFPCGTQPAGFPLAFASEVTFDEQEHAQTIPLFPVPPGYQPPGPVPGAFGAEANRVHVGGPAFPVPFNFGWFFLELNAPHVGGYVLQSWVETIMKAQGQYSVGFSATPFANGCEQVPQNRPGG
ncbi:MAG TPA: hypothetical protein VGM86_24270 [Thermoanaerobaculia bacterium]|jgi:hypothetical protein